MLSYFDRSFNILRREKKKNFNQLTSSSYPADVIVYFEKLLNARSTLNFASLSLSSLVLSFSSYIILFFWQWDKCSFFSPSLINTYLEFTFLTMRIWYRFLIWRHFSLKKKRKGHCFIFLSLPKHHNSMINTFSFFVSSFFFR